MRTKGKKARFGSTRIRTSMLLKSPTEEALATLPHAQGLRHLPLHSKHDPQARDGEAMQKLPHGFKGEKGKDR